MITIYHNPRCQKSRTALAYLETLGQNVEVVEYLNDTPSVQELKTIVAKLGIKPFDLVRTKEEIYKTLYKGKQLSDEQWIKVLHENPVLIERPIIVKDKKAVIGRDEESLQKIK